MTQTTASSRVAFIGLGVMGYPMAGHLARKGHGMTVYNRTAQKATAWVQEYGGATAETPAQAAADADYVFTCVGNDADLDQVILGPDGVLKTVRPGCVIIDNTTASADAARRLFAAAKGQRVDFLDAPVSGGQAGAQSGTLTVMIGGDQKAYQRAEPIVSAYARAVSHMGPAGSGQLTKMVNQICVAGVVQALAEGLAFAERAGLDASKVVEVISKGAAQSWQLDNRSATMLRREFGFGFAVDLMRKDLAMCLSEAQRNGSSLPVTALISEFYTLVQQQGGGELDSSSLMLLLDRSRP